MEQFPENEKQTIAIEKQQIIEQAHKLREKLLKAIEKGDVGATKQYVADVDRLIGDDSMDLLKRNPGNKLRSYKNFLLSHNTLYGYFAEKGGLSAVQAHYMTEKYAILIEHSDAISRLEQIHLDMLNYYSNPINRFQYNEKNSLVLKTENFIEMNFTEEIPIEQIARQLFVHPSHLMRTFKQEKGVTISHFRNRRRIKEAKQLLVYSRLPITGIAHMVGFTSSQYFSRVFKEEVGITPNQYRRKS
ncbi:AraC family transcriptional regulator [Sporosarcina ureilytica]|uniref:HTH araC/xylS-type domain-containing protein n=1 Tax=Sporosarcina ureilytica TaxID=298596 RepID=A0A1D8JIY4_9BACL|nr:AraC family transcriptional regulator [Sporosarcina ureilytica]AOV08667.1 hypothetical protein BI350_14730 [Sporosarcina ureilytica]